MSIPFDSDLSLIIVTARLSGPSGEANVLLAVDTGATSTVINAKVLATIGVDLFAPLETVRITMGNGVEYAPVFEIDALNTLEQERQNFPVVGYDLPPGTTLDGVLGLDFLRGQQLTIDFRAGLITLA